ncbi:MAG: hypothetical protein AB8G96_16585 [Phycisphaerales bacterium]
MLGDANFGAHAPKEASTGTAWLSRQHPFAFSLLVAIPVAFVLAWTGAMQLSNLERNQKFAAEFELSEIKELHRLVSANAAMLERDVSELSASAGISEAQVANFKQANDRLLVEINNLRATRQRDQAVDADIWNDLTIMADRPVSIDIMGYLYYLAALEQARGFENEELVDELATMIRAQLDRIREAGLSAEFVEPETIDLDGDGLADMDFSTEPPAESPPGELP